MLAAACGKHRNSLRAAGPQVAAHDAPLPAPRAGSADTCRARRRPHEPSRSASPERRRRSGCAPRCAATRSASDLQASVRSALASTRPRLRADASLAHGGCQAAGKLHLAHAARLAARRRPDQRRGRRAHRAPLRRRQQRPASAGAASAAPASTRRRRRQGARRRDADRVAGQRAASCRTCASTRSRSTSAGSPT